MMEDRDGKTENKCGSGKGFKTIGRLKKHTEKHTTAESVRTNLHIFNCNVCTKNFKNSKNLEVHIDKKHSGPVNGFGYQCCGKIYKTVGRFMKHKEKHKVMVTNSTSSATCEEFICDICKKTFDRAAKLQRHITQKHALCRKIVKCQYCCKVFSDNGKLNRHIVVHTGEKHFKCDVCNKTFNRKDHLQKHAMVHRPNSERLCKCPLCGRGFVESTLLRRHMNSHTGHKPYTCGLCNIRFYTDSTLKQHLGCHTGVRQYLCNECGKSFTRKGTLQVHMRSHNNERPYKCIVCDKNFTTQHGLTRHSRIHTGEMPYNCSKCGRQFARVDVYNYHKNRKRDCREDHKKEILEKNEFIIKTEGEIPLPDIEQWLKNEELNP